MTINATAVFRARPSGNNANGGGYDAAISGAGTDYSQQNTAQTSGSVGTAAGTTSFADATAAFTSAMIGNSIKITSGAGFTVGIYFVTGYTDATHVTLDRSPGTGSAAVWKLGGGWADPRLNSIYVQPGNIVYALGAGIPNYANLPGTADYTLTGFVTPTAGNATAGYVKFATDPATPNYSTGGRAIIKCDGLCYYNSTLLFFERLVCTVNGASNGALGFIGSTSGIVKECVFDQNGYDCSFTGGGMVHILNEVCSTVAKRSTNANPGILLGQYGRSVYGCNIHDCVGDGVATGNAGAPNITFSVIAKNGGNGINFNSTTAGFSMLCANNTIDNNLGHGIQIAAQLDLQNIVAFNNIISNHTGSGKYGMNVGAGTTAANDKVKSLIDFNTYYNNTTNVNAISLGASDTATGTNPFTNEGSNDFSIVSAFFNSGVIPSVALPQNLAGWNG